MTPLALEFLIHTTFFATDEVLKAKWSEVNYRENTWTIPAGRMKARRAHRVPLSKRCIEILQVLKTTKTLKRIFFRDGRVLSLSNGAFLSLLRRLDYQHITPHGFRSTFRDWAANKLIPFKTRQ